MGSVRALKPPIAQAGMSDADLVDLARAGNRRAAQALFFRHAERLNVLAFRLMGQDADLDDIVQETFARALANLDSLRDSRAFAGWIQGILVRTALSIIRRRRLWRRIGFGRDALRVDVDAVVGHVAPADHAVELRRVYAVLESLPAEVRVALVLHRVDGMSLEDVAKAMNLSLATVKRRIAAARSALSEVVEES